jgi:hypothetical protein
MVPVVGKYPDAAASAFLLNADKPNYMVRADRGPRAPADLEGGRR